MRSYLLVTAFLAVSCIEKELLEEPLALVMLMSSLEAAVILAFVEVSVRQAMTAILLKQAFES